MKKANRIRILFCLVAVVSVMSYYLAHELALQKSSPPTQLAEVTQTEEEVVKSSYTRIPFEYVMVAEDGYLTVYMADLVTVYMYTDIPLDGLSEELKDEIAKGKFFADLRELYQFLENYSS